MILWTKTVDLNGKSLLPYKQIIKIGILILNRLKYAGAGASRRLYERVGQAIQPIMAIIMSAQMGVSYEFQNRL